MGARERTGTGTRERRNTNRLDVDGGVGVGPDMAEASRLPEVAKEMKCLPAGEAAFPPPPPGVSAAVTLPPEPTFLARISRVLLFLGNVAGGGGDGGGDRRRASRRDSVELCVKYGKTRKGPRETFARVYSTRHGNKKNVARVR